MADDEPTSDADEAEMPDQPETPELGASVKRFVTIFLFILALFVIFDTDLRNAMGDAVGAVLGPLFAFNHQFPVLTFFPVAIVMVLATSAIRHVMMDWKEMAKVQHITSHLNKELFQATKDENKYKMKKLNELKESEEFAELQSKQMGSTWKVMGPTMIIAVAIFSWMFSFAAAPVPFTVQAPEDSVTMVWDTNLLHAEQVEADGSFQVSQAADVYVFGPRSRTAAVIRGWDEASFQGPLLGPLNVEAGRTVDLQPGTYDVRSIPGDPVLKAGNAKLVFPVVAVTQDGAIRHVQKINPSSAGTVTVEQGETVHAFVPSPQTTNSGVVQVEFVQAQAGGQASSTTIDLTREHVLHLPPGPTTHVVSKVGRVPWATFNLNDTTILPNWILLYSLFTIPFGYLFQKLFKAYAYRDEIDDVAEV